jgi:hypothetical protein
LNTGLPLSHLSGFGVEVDEQLVRHRDTHDLGRFAAGTETLLEVYEVRLVAADYAAPCRPMRASRQNEQISTPQMMRVTVTCLVCAIEVIRLCGRA